MPESKSQAFQNNPQMTQISQIGTTKSTDSRDPQTYAIIGAAMEIHNRFSDIIVEFKALTRLTSTEEAQLLNYLKATGLRRRLLINFGTPGLQYKRLVWGYENKKSV